MQRNRNANATAWSIIHTMDKAEQNQTDNTVKNGTAPNTSGNTSGNIPGNSPVGASARPETVASETTASEAAAENTTKAGYTQSAPAESSAAKTSAAASSPAEATAPGMEAVQVDAVQIDSARLDSTHSVYSNDLDPDDDYEEVVEEYATTDAPDGTHREERRITRTASRATRKQPPRVTLMVPPRLLTRANLKRTLRLSARLPAPSRTRRVAPRAPACSARSASTAARRTWRRGRNAPPRPCSWRPYCTCSRSPRPL